MGEVTELLRSSLGKSRLAKEKHICCLRGLWPLEGACPIPGSIQGQAGGDFEQLAPVEDVHSHGRSGINSKVPSNTNHSRMILWMKKA